MLKKIILLLCLIFSSFSFSEAPGVMYYQGRLFDALGEPLDKNNTEIIVKVYDAASEGNLAWGPQTFRGVSIVDGYFEIVFGGKEDNGTRNLSSQLKSGLAYLEITADSQVIIPRQKMESVPYAMNSKNSVLSEKSIKSDYAENAGDGVPKGAVISFALKDCPNGYSEYTRAYGRFVRGVDKSKTSIDPDGERSIGNLQGDLFKEHIHHNADNTRYLLRSDGNGTAWQVDRTSGEPNLVTPTRNVSRGGSETRPKNVSLLYCIKQ